MNRKLWRRLQCCFEMASQLLVEQRLPALLETCSDPREFQMVARLLRAGLDPGPSPIDYCAADLLKLSEDGRGAVKSKCRIGPYELLEELGRGGTSVVYRSESQDGTGRRPVAVKVLLLHHHTGGLELLSQETDILRSLNHPCVARYIDSGLTQDGYPFLVMEYIDGIPINRYCKSARMSAWETVRLFREVASAVEYLDQRGIVHGDLKPANVLVQQCGKPMILDFGVSRVAQQLDGGSQIPGSGMALTPEYAAPERVSGGAVSRAGDIYSLGVLLYELLAGRVPFILENLVWTDMIRVVSEAKPLRISKVNPARAGEADAELEAIIGKAMAKNPQERPNGVSEFRADLDAWLGPRQSR